MAKRRFQTLIGWNRCKALVRRLAPNGGGASLPALLRRFVPKRFEHEEDPLLADVYEGPVRRGDESLDDTVYRPSSS